MPLYKYLRPERIDVLQRREIRFTQPGALNDPFELRPRFEALVSEAETLAGLTEKPIDLDPMLRDAYAMLPAEQRSILPYETAAAAIGSLMETDEARSRTSAALMSVLQSMKDISPPVSERIYRVLNSNVGILSLTEMRNEVRMWEHYADNCRGLVLAFDEKNPFFNRRRMPNDEFYFLRKVLYSDEPATSSLLETDGDAVFITKGKNWEYEREWRMLAPLASATRRLSVGGDTVFLFAFPSNALESVILGARAELGLETTIRELFREDKEFSHVKILHSELNCDDQRVRVI